MLSRLLKHNYKRFYPIRQITVGLYFSILDKWIVEIRVGETKTTTKRVLTVLKREQIPPDVSRFSHQFTFILKRTECGFCKCWLVVSRVLAECKIQPSSVYSVAPWGVCKCIYDNVGTALRTTHFISLFLFFFLLLFFPTSISQPGWLLRYACFTRLSPHAFTFKVFLC